MGKNIVLIGFRAAGKTTIGELLAQALGFSFLDTDILVEERAGQTIAQIVAKQGWVGFRKREKDVIKEISKQQNLVIAVGGGAVLDDENVECLKQNSLFIWLKASPKTIFKRLLKDEKTALQRPRFREDSLVREITQVLNQRLAVYQRLADREIDTEAKSLEEITKTILDLIKSNKFL
jgi:shikimate kinase